VKRIYAYRPTLFFLLAFGLSWIPWFCAAYAGSRQGLAAYAPLFQLVGIAGPTAAALFLVFTSGSESLKRDFRDRLFNPLRIRPVYVPIAVALPLAVIVVSIAISLLFGQSADQFRLSGGGNLIATVLLTMLLAPLLEEIGWHGYGVDSLRAGLGMLKATLVFGVLWSAWHAPAALIPGTYQHQLAEMPNPVYLANFFVSIIPAAFIANWFYYRNDRSILGAVLMHSMLNAASVLVAAGQVAKCIATLLYAAVAVALVLSDREFRQGPRNFLGEDTGEVRQVP
jgi:membrane protease YdiL (CAAX protease family)